MSKTGRIRVLIDSVFQKANLPSPMRMAPELEFQVFSDPFVSGVVECLELGFATYEDLSPEHLSLIGGVIAICTWFGITDLHVDNLAFGKNLTPGGQVTFFPIDIECIFEKVMLPSQTSLVSNPHALNGIFDKAGLFQLREQGAWENPLNFASLLDGFMTAMDCLDSNAHTIFESLLKMKEVQGAPIRVIARATRTYVELGQDRHALLEPSLLPSESEQLDRGDIPYFFRTLTSSAVFHYSSFEGAIQASGWTKDKNGYFDVPEVFISDHLEGKVDLQEFSRRRHAASALQLVRYFSPKLQGDKYSIGKTTVSLSHEMIQVRYRDQPLFETNRAPVLESK
ncbi:hypothetical protein WDW86_16740 [Bdellovibrionota bacterium FG-2]